MYRSRHGGRQIIAGEASGEQVTARPYFFLGREFADVSWKLVAGYHVDGQARSSGHHPLHPAERLKTSKTGYLLTRRFACYDLATALSSSIHI